MLSHILVLVSISRSFVSVSADQAPAACLRHVSGGQTGHRAVRLGVEEMHEVLRFLVTGLWYPDCLVRALGRLR